MKKLLNEMDKHLDAYEYWLTCVDAAGMSVGDGYAEVAKVNGVALHTVRGWAYSFDWGARRALLEREIAVIAENSPRPLTDKELVKVHTRMELQDVVSRILDAFGLRLPDVESLIRSLPLYDADDLDVYLKMMERLVKVQMGLAGAADARVGMDAVMAQFAELPKGTQIAYFHQVAELRAIVPPDGGVGPDGSPSRRGNGTGGNGSVGAGSPGPGGPTAPPSGSNGAGDRDEADM